MAAKKAVLVSGSAGAAVAAVLTNPARERSEQEKAFDACVASVVFKARHRKIPPPPDVRKHKGYQQLNYK